MTRALATLAAGAAPATDRRNPHTVELYRRLARIRPPDPAVAGDGRRWLREVRYAGAALPGAPWWLDDLDAGEVVRLSDGSRYRVEDVAPLCVRGEIDLHAVDEWIRTAPATGKAKEK